MYTIETCLDKLQHTSPLVLSITNLVTINDCANAILAVGGSPVMSDDPQDAADLAGKAAATVINIGTTNGYKLEVMLAAASSAKKAGKTVVLDPVGVGATELRRQTALTILNKSKPDIIRGNFSEIKALAGLTTAQKGVDSAENDNPETMGHIAHALSSELKLIVAITGATDVVANGRAVSFIKGGSPVLTRLTGTGCMLSAIVGAYAGANQENIHQSLIAALVHMSLAGERAIKETADERRLGTFKLKLFDHLSLINGSDLASFKGIRHEKI